MTFSTFWAIPPGSGNHDADRYPNGNAHRHIDPNADNPVFRPHPVFLPLVARSLFTP